MSATVGSKDPQQILGSYYPSFVARLRLKFDESYNVFTSAPPSDVSQPESPASFSTFFNGRLNNVTQEPLIFARGRYTQLADRVPVKADVDLSGIRQAWKFNLTFDFRDLPIDPRLVRAALVQLHLGAVDPRDFADGMLLPSSNFQSGIFAPDATAQAPSFVQTVKDGQPNGDTLLFVGIVDSWHIEHGTTGSWVSMEGRDLRGLLQDVKVPLASPGIINLNLSQTISQVVADILKTLPIDESTTIYVKSQFQTGPEPSPGDADGVTRVRQGAAGKPGTSGVNVGTSKVKPTSKVTMSPPGANSGGGDRISYWDLITQYCFLVGAVPYFIGNVIAIRPARDIFSQVADPDNTPFAGGQSRLVSVEGGSPAIQPINVRRLVYGRDVEKITYDRKYNTVAVPTVVAVSIDDTVRGNAKLLEEQWPPKESKTDQIKGDNEVIKIPAYGIRDRNRLQQIAHDAYEEIGRGEVGGSCDTRVITSFGGSNADPDLLRLRPTDAVELLVDARALSANAPSTAELIDQQRRSFQEQVNALTLRLGDENLARVLAATARSAVVGQLNFFRVNNVKFSWGKDGIQISFDFQNYVVARQNEPSVFQKLGRALAGLAPALMKVVTTQGAYNKTIPPAAQATPKATPQALSGASAVAGFAGQSANPFGGIDPAQADAVRLKWLGFP